MKNNKRLNIKSTIYKHVTNNKKEYILVTLIFLVGIFLGVMFVNNTQENQISEITSYLNNFVDKLKNIEKLDNMQLLKTTIVENITLAVILWFFGTTVIRNTYSFWNNIIQRILLRIHYSINNCCNGNRKRNIIYFYVPTIAKHNIYSSYYCNWSKSDLNYINQQ